MDFQKNVVLKENYTFLVADAEGAVSGGEKGLYDRDTRFLSRYAWELGPDFQTLLAHSARPDRFEAHHALLAGPSQLVGVRRRLTIGGRRLHDRLTVENTGQEPRRVRLALRLAADFIDLFEARGWFAGEREPVRASVRGAEAAFAQVAKDGLRQGVRLRFSQAPDAYEDGVLTFERTLAAHATWDLGVEVELDNPLDDERAGPCYDAWRERFATLAPPPGGEAALARAIDDLRGLLLFTGAGAVPAAGIPWFVAAFGRDALLTAHLLLPYAPEVAEGTLRYLATLQAREDDPYREAQPGKIPHEIRFGELARTGAVPHSPYYGTVDATALFVSLLGAVADVTGSDALVRELRPTWEAALGWMTGPADPDGDGFLEFGAGPSEPGSGLSVQSWKDSADSMSHADGSLALGPLAVSEVQGYAYAAYRAAAAFHRALGEPAGARAWDERAERLKRRFHERFWLAELGCYALALDGDKRPLAVLSSDAGQLLWTGIVPEEMAPRLVATLFGDACWSGWGFRTLGSAERRYNPLSYHNGSVWPHDTALIAAGLERYGFTVGAARVARAVYALADAEPDARLPELVGGYPRGDGPAVPYPVACRPQAWDAAALVHLARLWAPEEPT